MSSRKFSRVPVCCTAPVKSLIDQNAATNITASEPRYATTNQAMGSESKPVSRTHPCRCSPADSRRGSARCCSLASPTDDAVMSGLTLDVRPSLRPLAEVHADVAAAVEAVRRRRCPVVEAVRVRLVVRVVTSAEVLVGCVRARKRLRARLSEPLRNLCVHRGRHDVVHPLVHAVRVLRL